MYNKWIVFIWICFGEKNFYNNVIELVCLKEFVGRGYIFFLLIKIEKKWGGFGWVNYIIVKWSYEC